MGGYLLASLLSMRIFWIEQFPLHPTEVDTVLLFGGNESHRCHDNEYVNITSNPRKNTDTFPSNHTVTKYTIFEFFQSFVAIFSVKTIQHIFFKNI